jgi:hypothetical protein
MPFLTSTDIANRGLQLIGVPRVASISPVPDQSKPAVEAAFCYGKLKRSELRRVVWTFATRRALMRPVVSTTMALVPPAYSSATTYAAGQIVSDTSGVWWISLVAGNIGNALADTSAVWQLYTGQQVAQVYSSTVQYLPGDIVYVSTTAYFALQATLGNAPSGGAPNWVTLTSATLVALLALNPAAYTPATLVQRTVYRLPYNYLRIAPQDVKTAGTPRQSVAAGMRFNDWEFENGFLISSATTTPFIFRYICDVAYVPSMDDLFCESLASRMGMELAEPLTQNPDKAKDAKASYMVAINDAHTINAIEAGSTEDELVQSNSNGPAMPQQGGGG